jgi:hypothetical protein
MRGKSGHPQEATRSISLPVLVKYAGWNHVHLTIGDNDGKDQMGIQGPLHAVQSFRQEGRKTINAKVLWTHAPICNI